MVKRPFQFRSRQRDTETDQLRIGSVVQAIDAAVKAAIKEREALRTRVSIARDLASFAVGTDDDEYLTRELKDTLQLKEYEQQMTVGEDRLRILDHQIGSLTVLRDLSRQCFAELTK
jgi:hypothetical protein